MKRTAMFNGFDRDIVDDVPRECNVRLGELGWDRVGTLTICPCPSPDAAR